jgi:hypothetical protein
VAKIVADDVLQLGGGLRVLVTAALASTGHYLVQLAKRSNNFVIGTVGSADEVPVLRDLGADRIINRAEDDLDAVLEQDFHHMIDVVFDAMGGEVLDICLKHTASRGRIIVSETLREHLHDENSLHTIDIYHDLIERSISIHGFHLADYAQGIVLAGRQMIELYEAGEIQSIVDPESFEGIARVPDALSYVMSGRARGKVVVKLV